MHACIYKCMYVVCCVCVCVYFSYYQLLLLFNSFEILFVCSHLLLAVSINALAARQQAWRGKNCIFSAQIYFFTNFLFQFFLNCDKMLHAAVMTANHNNNGQYIKHKQIQSNTLLAAKDSLLLSATALATSGHYRLYLFAEHHIKFNITIFFN